MLARQMPKGDPRQSIIDKIVKQTFRASEIVNICSTFRGLAGGSRGH